MPAKTRIQESAAATIKRLEEKDRGLGQMLKKAYGYAVFPAVGKASLVVGGSYGHGAVFERGKFIGHATLSQLTIGVQVGGDTFTEVLVFENKEALDRLKKGKMAFAANASAVLVKAGATGTKNFTNGVAAYAYSRGGMLLEAVIGGQKFSFKPADEEEQEDQGGEEGEEQQESSRGGSKGKAAASQEEESDEGEDEQEGEEDSGDAEDNGEDEEAGVLGRAMGGVKSAASSVSETAKAHPVAATVIGTALVASAAFFVVRAVRSRSGKDGEDQEDTDAKDQADEGEEEPDEGEDEEKADTLNQLRRRRSKA